MDIQKKFIMMKPIHIMKINNNRLNDKILHVRFECMNCGYIALYGIDCPICHDELIKIDVPKRE